MREHSFIDEYGYEQKILLRRIIPKEFDKSYKKGQIAVDYDRGLCIMNEEVVAEFVQE